MDILQAFRDELDRPTGQRPLSSWLLPNEVWPEGIPTPEEEALQPVISPVEAAATAPTLSSSLMRVLLSLGARPQTTPARSILDKGLEGLAGNDYWRYQVVAPRNPELPPDR